VTLVTLNLLRRRRGMKGSSSLMGRLLSRQAKGLRLKIRRTLGHSNAASDKPTFPGTETKKGKPSPEGQAGTTGRKAYSLTFAEG